MFLGKTFLSRLFPLLNIEEVKKMVSKVKLRSKISLLSDPKGLLKIIPNFVPALFTIQSLCFKLHDGG